MFIQGIGIRRHQKRWGWMQNMRQATSQVFVPNLESQLWLQWLVSRTSPCSRCSTTGQRDKWAGSVKTRHISTCIQASVGVLRSCGKRICGQVREDPVHLEVITCQCLGSDQAMFRTRHVFSATRAYSGQKSRWTWCEGFQGVQCSCHLDKMITPFGWTAPPTFSKHQLFAKHSAPCLVNQLFYYYSWVLKLQNSKRWSWWELGIEGRGNKCMEKYFKRNQEREAMDRVQT